MKLIIGLGNPTKQYEQTRHNIGFMVIDKLAQDLGIVTFQKKFESEYALRVIDGEKILFVKPQTYMNNSGVSVRKWVDYYDIELSDIYVIHDELDLPFGTLRLKKGGSAGGHNGLKSIIAHLASQDFNRLRMGIGKSPFGETIHHVLSNFSGAENTILKDEFIPLAIQVFADMQTISFLNLMNTYNQKKKD